MRRPTRPERPAGRVPAALARVDPEADRREALALMAVSRETEERLALYAERLRRWQAIKNLVGASTFDHLWTRHFADSAQLLAHAPDARRWADLGSGAGFPGLVIAILLAGRPGARVHLIESNNRKCAFLREVARDTGAPAVVHAGRIDAVLATLREPVDVVTSRAVTGLVGLLSLSRPLLDRGARGLFLTGAEGAADMIGASLPCDIGFAPSRTQAGSRIAMVQCGRSWEKGA